MTSFLSPAPPVAGEGWHHALMDLHDLSGQSLASLIDREWILAEAWGGQVKGINQVRALTMDESRQALTDAALVRFFARDVGWTETWANWMTFQTALEKLSSSRKAGGAPLELSREIETATVASLRSLTATVARLSEPSVLSTVRGPVSDEHNELLAAIDWPRRVDRLRRIWAAQPSTWTDLADDSKEGMTSQFPVFTPTVAALLDLQDSDLAVEVLLAAYLHDAELVLASLLQDCEQKIVSASRNLKELTVDVLGGQAVLLDRAGLRERPLVLNRFDLQLQWIQAVHLSLRNSKALLSAYRPSPDTVGDPEVTVPESTSTTETQEEESEASEGPNIAPPEPPLDLRGLVISLRTLSSTLEERWSDALEYSLTRADLDDELAGWSTVVAAIAQVTEERERREPVLIPSFPLGRSDLSGISPTAEGEAKKVQQEIANMYTLRALLHSIPALQSPPNVRFSFAGGQQSIKHWWSSGGFYCVVSTADLAVRIIEEIQIGPGEAEAQSTHPASTDLALATRAYQMGLPEASVIYLNRALKGLFIPAVGPDVTRRWGQLR